MQKRFGLLAGLFLAGFALRPQIVGVGPLIPSIERDLDVSHAVAGLLNTIPVLCMGLFALPAPVLTRRYGSRLALADHDAELGLEIALGHDRRDHDRLPRADQRIRPFGEQQRRVRRRDSLLLRVVAVVQADTDDLRRTVDRQHAGEPK